MHRKSRMSRKKLTIVSLATVPLVAGLGFAVTNVAFAGTNGQKVQICQPQSDYRSVLLSGTNQNGDFQPDLPFGNLTQNCAVFEGYFWKGDVTIKWQDPVSGRNPNAQTTCNVPEFSTLDVQPCFGPSNQAPPQPSPSVTDPSDAAGDQPGNLNP